MVIPIIYDHPEDKSIEVALDLENGLTISILMTDEQAQEMIGIIQNKLNGRWKG